MKIKKKKGMKVNRRCSSIIALHFLVLFVSLWWIPVFSAEPADGYVRAPAMAGKFYPGDAKKLEAAVKGFLQDALTPRGERPIAIVVPHAGYIYSGQIAADAYKQAMGYPYDVVVILGTNHTVAPFEGVSVFQGRGYATPLGVAEIDRPVAQALAAADPAFAYRPEAHKEEHSEEVQVPFVQVAFPQAKIVTAIVGTSDLGVTERFGKALARVLKDKKALIVASSDLSHYPPYGEAVEADRATLKAIASLDPAVLATSIAEQERKGRRGLVTCACGEAPILAAMYAARALGARRGVVVSHANSGDTAVGDYNRVVGYGAVLFTAGDGGPDTKVLEPAAPASKPVALSDADRKFLLALARKTLERYFLTDTLPLPRSDSPALRQDHGAFVTLKEHGDLRGCIGHMAEDTPLVLTVAKMALEAALNDPRFASVRPEELPSIEMEISVLTPFARVDGPGAIQVGRDGALIKKGDRQAVFLPQVAPEEGWSREEMLEHLCAKAGMPTDCWKSGCTFYTFQADVFGEQKKK